MSRGREELYYLGPDGKLMAVELTTTAALLADVPKAGEVEVTASAVVSAIQASAKIIAQGHAERESNDVVCLRLGSEADLSSLQYCK
jgi:hypothetical protein